MRASWRMLAASVCASAAPAQNLFISYYDAPAHLEKRTASGALIWTTSGGTGDGWVGACPAPNGDVLTTRRVPTVELERFDSSGFFVSSVALPQVSQQAQGDINVFADGTLAVCSWDSHSIELFTQAGSHVGTFQAAGMTHPFGGCIDGADRLWVIWMPNFPSGSSQITTFDRSGALVQSYASTYLATDLVVDPVGELWLIDFGGTVHHATGAGAELASFASGLTADGYGIARLDDGSLWTTSYSDSNVRHVSSTGIPLGSFVASSGNAFFLRTDSVCGAVTSYCTAGTSSFGCNGHLWAVGVPSASGATSFTIHASGVDGLKQGMIFYGITGAIASPWGVGGTSYSCVHPPWQRSFTANSGGAFGSCNGAYALDWNAFFASHPAALGSPLQSSATFYAQAWWRDPGAPKASSLSDALSFVLCP